MQPVLRHLTALAISLGVSVAYGYVEEQPLKQSVLFGFGMAVLFSAILILEARRARVGGAERVESMVVVRDESGEALLLTGEEVRGQENRAVERLTTRRLDDGAVLLRTNDLRLVGAAQTHAWCATEEDPLHLRHPRTHEVLLTGEKLVKGFDHAARLKPLTGSDDPSPVAALSSAHALLTDGRGLLFKPDRSIEEKKRGDVVHASHSTSFDSRASFGDLAHLHFDGGTNPMLHGLQPMPQEPLRFLRGALFTTGMLRRASRLDDLVILVAHREADGDAAPELLSRVSLDGQLRWTARFEKPVLARAKTLLVQAPLAALLLGRERDQPLELLALNLDTGATSWRLRP